MKAKVSLSLDRAVADDARALGINMSRVAEAAISDANRQARAKAWRAENADALDAMRQDIEENGVPLDQHRQF